MSQKLLCIGASHFLLVYLDDLDVFYDTFAQTNTHMECECFLCNFYRREDVFFFSKLLSSHKGLREIQRFLFLPVVSTLRDLNMKSLFSFKTSAVVHATFQQRNLHFLPVLNSLVGHIGLATRDQMKMEHRFIFIDIVFIIRAF